MPNEPRIVRLTRLAMPPRRYVDTSIRERSFIAGRLRSQRRTLYPIAAVISNRCFGVPVMGRKAANQSRPVSPVFWMPIRGAANSFRRPPSPIACLSVIIPNMTSLSLKNLDLNPATLRAVAAKARRSGQTTPQYVRSLIERDLLADQSFDEILRPIRDDVRKKGITEEQLDQIVQRARRATGAKGARTRR